MARREDATQQFYTPAAQPKVDLRSDRIAWGEPSQGVRFGLRAPDAALEAGGPIQLELVCKNDGLVPVWLFGFVKRYPRALRVSPPKVDRPHIRVSFGDVNVLH